MKKIQNDGKWETIRDFMIAENPPFGFEFMGSPPIRRNNDGSLFVRIDVGFKLCKVGEFLVSNGKYKYDVLSNEASKWQKKS